MTPDQRHAALVERMLYSAAETRGYGPAWGETRLWPWYLHDPAGALERRFTHGTRIWRVRGLPPLTRAAYSRDEIRAAVEVVLAALALEDA